MNRAADERRLLQLTSLPTAAGREHAVLRWIDRWARARRFQLEQDAWGNRLIRRPNRLGLRDWPEKAEPSNPPHGPANPDPAPIVWTAHLDHPAFVIADAVGRYEAEAEFRGGVKASFFRDAPVLWRRGASHAVFGRVRAYDERSRRATLQWTTPARPPRGEPVGWAVGPARIVRQPDGTRRLRAPACDDLAAVAAAVCAFERTASPHVALLLTRAEEVGFLGAVAACREGLIPRDASVINLENSRSFADSPLGAGPVVRVGDRTSTFDPDLLDRLNRLAQALTDEQTGFQFQRKLMPGGTCEASAYQSFGRRAACLCLPLENYHNMNEPRGRIDAEIIDVEDFHRLVALLERTPALADAPAAPSLRKRLTEWFESNRRMLRTGR